MTNYLVTDLETTGLSADDDVILEAAFIIIDERGNEYGSFETLVHEDTQQYLSALNRVHFEEGVVEKMHRESGLWADYYDERVSSLTLNQLSVHLIKWLYDAEMTPGTMPLLGNSIGSLDRPFIQKHLPALNDFVSYRNYDVSTLRMTVADHRPELQTAWEVRFEEYAEDFAEYGKAHRAMFDARASVMQREFYLSRLGLL